MRTNANWCVRTLAVALVLAMVFMALSCGGGGGATANLNANNNGNATLGPSGLSRTTGLVVTEDEIATLPAWQQELLSDPGWNQPYIPPREATQIDPPTQEMLFEYTRESMESGVEIVPRKFNPSGKNASWTDQQGFGGETIVKGEYPASATPNPGPNGSRDATPLYGCNSDGSDESAQGNAIEDLIDQQSMPLQRISYVLQGLSTANFFNATGGSGNDMQSAVYQLFPADQILSSQSRVPESAP